MGEVTRIPTRPRLVTGQSLLSDPAHRLAGPAARVVASHRLAEQAAHELHDGSPGSGIKALSFAAGTHLALTIGADAAADFFEMVARVVRHVGQPPEEPSPVVDCGDGLFLRGGREGAPPSGGEDPA